MGRARRRLVAAGQARDNGARLAVQRGQAGAVAQGLRLWHRNAAAGQVVHQLDIERQLRVRQHFEQRQHVLATAGMQEVIGVFDARRDPS